MRFLIAFLLLTSSANAYDFNTLWTLNQSKLIVFDEPYRDLSPSEQCARAQDEAASLDDIPLSKAKEKMACRPNGWDANLAGTEFLTEMTIQDACIKKTGQFCD